MAEQYANVTVSYRMHGDRRFALLAELAGWTVGDACWRMVTLWARCTALQTDRPPAVEIRVHLGLRGEQLLLDAALGERQPDGAIRVLGGGLTGGDTDRFGWYEPVREQQRDAGLKRARTAVRGPGGRFGAGPARSSDTSSADQRITSAGPAATSGSPAVASGPPASGFRIPEDQKLSPARDPAVPPPAPHPTRPAPAPTTRQDLAREQQAPIREREPAPGEQPQASRESPVSREVEKPETSVERRPVAPIVPPGESAWHRRQRWWGAMLEADARIRAAGIEPNAPALPKAPAGTNESNMGRCERQLLDGGATLDEVDAKMRHIVLVAEAEALRPDNRSRRWFKPALIWDPERAARAVDTSLEEASRPRSTPRGSPASPAAASRKPRPERTPPDPERTAAELAELAAMANSAAADPDRAADRLRSLPTPELVKRFGDGPRAPPVRAAPMNTDDDTDQKPQRKAST